MPAEPTLSPKVVLFALSESEFTRTDANIQYAFAKGEGGKVDSVKIRVNKGTSEARRLAKDEAIPYEQLIAGKFAEAVEAYKKIKRETPNNNAVEEERLNSVGYSLLGQKKIAAAIAVFKANVELYPQSWNVYDSLGDALVAGHPLSELGGALEWQRHEEFLDPLVDETQARLEVDDGLAFDAEAEVPGLDDARVHRAHRNLVDALAPDLLEGERLAVVVELPGLGVLAEREVVRRPEPVADQRAGIRVPHRTDAEQVEDLPLEP